MKRLTSLILAVACGGMVGFMVGAVDLIPWQRPDSGSPVWEAFQPDGCKDTWAIALWDRDGREGADRLPDLQSPYLMCVLSTIDGFFGHDSRCVTWSTLAQVTPISSTSARLDFVDPAGQASREFIKLKSSVLSGASIEYYPSEAFDKPYHTHALSKTWFYRRRAN